MGVRLLNSRSNGVGYLGDVVQELDSLRNGQRRKAGCIQVVLSDALPTWVLAHETHAWCPRETRF